MSLEAATTEKTLKMNTIDIETTVEKPALIVPSYRDNSPGEMGLHDLMTRVHEDQKEDFAFRHQHLEMTYDPERSFRIRVGNDLDIPFNAHFQSQASASLAKGLDTFTRDCLANNRPDLIVDVHNRLFRDQPRDRKAMVRTISNGMPKHGRAFLSDSFRRIDDDVVFGAMLPVIAEHKEKFEAIGGKRTDYKTFLKVVSREPVFQIQSGGRTRRFHVGFAASNSEVGQGYTAAHAFFTDAFCKNGCIWSQKSIVDMKMAHRGSKIRSDFEGLIGDAINRAKAEEAVHLIEEATKAACSFDDYGPFIDMIESAARDEIAGEPVKVLEAVAERVKLTKPEVEKLPLYYNADEPTRLGVNSAITALAQKASSYDRRVELERAGGEVLAMPKRTWDAVAALA